MLFIFVYIFSPRNYIFLKGCFCYVILQKLVEKIKKRQKAEGLRPTHPYNQVFMELLGKKKYDTGHASFKNKSKTV